jgi:hypothetical protein
MFFPEHYDYTLECSGSAGSIHKSSKGKGVRGGDHPTSRNPPHRFYRYLPTMTKGAQ